MREKTSTDYQRTLYELAERLRVEDRYEEAIAVEQARRAWIFGETRINCARADLHKLGQVLSPHIIDNLRRNVCQVDPLFPDRAGYMDRDRGSEE